MRRRQFILGILTFLLAVAQAHAQSTADKLRAFDRVVIIFMENRSFDNVFGNFPGANGLANAGAAARQLQANGVAYDTLPRPLIFDHGKYELGNL